MPERFNSTRSITSFTSTRISSEVSVHQICELVSRCGGTRFELRWGEGRQGTRQLVAIRFGIEFDALGEVPVCLRPQTEVIASWLRSTDKWRSMSAHRRERKIESQAYRIAWRHVKLLVEQLLLAVTLGLKTPGAAFMDGVEVEDPRTGDVVTMDRYLHQYGRALLVGSPIRLAT